MNHGPVGADDPLAKTGPLFQDDSILRVRRGPAVPAVCLKEIECRMGWFAHFGAPAFAPILSLGMASDGRVFTSRKNIAATDAIGRLPPDNLIPQLVSATALCHPQDLTAGLKGLLGIWV